MLHVSLLDLGHSSNPSGPFETLLLTSSSSVLLKLKSSETVLKKPAQPILIKMEMLNRVGDISPG